MAEASVSVENEGTEPLVAALMWGIGHSVCACALIVFLRTGFNDDDDLLLWSQCTNFHIT